MSIQSASIPFGITKAPVVRAIEVRGLFGTSDYDLVLQGSDSRLMILYGDNGTGKSTILRMLFCLLSSVDSKGHKSAIAKTIFKSIRITLADDSYVEASRETARLGDFELVCKLSDSKAFRVALKANAEGKISVKEDKATSIKYKALLLELGRLGIGAYYVSDRRRALTFNDSFTERKKPYEEVVYSSGKVVRRHSGEEEPMAAILRTLHSWVRNTLIAQVKEGDKNSNAIYSDIIRNISKSSVRKKKTRLVDLYAELGGLSERTSEFAKHGLLAPLDFEKVLAPALRAGPSKQDAIVAVLEPYLESLRARLDAMESTYQLISGFVDGINSYLHKKHITFHLTEGVSIVTVGGSQLDPELLSSGEKQLLHLFARTLMATSRANLFIIDEPEISLNIKWQRRLVASLLELPTHSDVQFILASHSMELISRYRPSVCQLHD